MGQEAQAIGHDDDPTAMQLVVDEQLTASSRPLPTTGLRVLCTDQPTPATLGTPATIGAGRGRWRERERERQTWRRCWPLQPGRRWQTRSLMLLPELRVRCALGQPYFSANPCEVRNRLIR